MGAAIPDVRLDHVALLPASLLVVQDHWKPLLDDLLTGEVFVLIPAGEGTLRPILEFVALALATMGHHITRMDADQFSSCRPRWVRGERAKELRG